MRGATWGDLSEAEKSFWAADDDVSAFAVDQKAFLDARPVDLTLRDRWTEKTVVLPRVFLGERVCSGRGRKATLNWGASCLDGSLSEEHDCCFHGSKIVLSRKRPCFPAAGVSSQTRDARRSRRRDVADSRSRLALRYSIVRRGSSTILPRPAGLTGSACQRAFRGRLEA